MALPGIGLDDEGKELATIKDRRGRWSAVPKEDRRESVREYIQNTRSILLARIAMNDKKREAERMREYIAQKESVLKLNKEIYDQDRKMVNEYVEYMKDKANAQKEKADETARKRKEKEDELESLIRKRTELKKVLGENKERCGTLKGFVDFIFSLNPDLEKQILERRNKRAASSLLLEKGEKGTAAEGETTDEEVKEIKRDYGLSENDSDTEISPGFTSPEEMIAVMQKQASENFALIQDVQKREESLERMRKQHSQKMSEKKVLLARIENDLRELEEERKRKNARL